MNTPDTNECPLGILIEGRVDGVWDWRHCTEGSDVKAAACANWNEAHAVVMYLLDQCGWDERDLRCTAIEPDHAGGAS